MTARGSKQKHIATFVQTQIKKVTDKFPTYPTEDGSVECWLNKGELEVGVFSGKVALAFSTEFKMRKNLIGKRKGKIRKM